MDTNFWVVLLAALVIAAVVIVKQFISWRRKIRQGAMLVKMLGETMTELRRLQETFRNIATVRDPLVEILYFFQAMSEWQDRGGVSDFIRELKRVDPQNWRWTIEKLQTLQKHFQNAGRDEFGWNRTKKGEMVTAEKVYLGNIYGLFTHPVSFWRQKKDDKKGGWGYSGMDHLNAYDVVSNQARKFMASHIEPMTQIIDDLNSFTVEAHLAA